MQRILIVGHGSIGKRHLSIARTKFPESKILVLSHFNTKSNFIQLASNVTSSLEEALSFKPQIAIIANPAPFHCNISKKLIELNCKLLIEKPLSNSVSDGIELLNVANAFSAKCQIGYNLRFSTSLAIFREYILAKHIGDVLSVRASVGQYLPDWRPTSDYRLGVSAQRHLGGGALLELSHEIDYIQWIFGRITWVSAHLPLVSNLEINVEDSAFLLLGIKTQSGSEIVVSLILDFVRRDSHRSCCVIGTQGTLLWDGLSSSTKYYDANQRNWIFLKQNSEPVSQTYIAQFDYFTSDNQTNSIIPCNLEFALDTLLVIEAARISSQNNSIKTFVEPLSL